MRKRSYKEPIEKPKSPFVRYCTYTVASVILASCSITFLMFGNNTMFTRKDITRTSANVDLPVSYEKTIREIEKDEDDSTLGLGQVDTTTGDPDIVDQPYTPGVSIDVDASQMYQSITVNSSTGSVMSNGLPFHNGWPSEWGDGNVTFINWPGLVNKWYEDAGQIIGTNSDDIRKQNFSVASDGYCSDQLEDVNGVTSLPMCYYPAMCIPNYYERSFAGENVPWSTSIASSYYACLVFENDTGDTAYLPITQSDNKGHTSPGGILQTWVKYAPDGDGTWGIANTIHVNGATADKSAIPGFTYIKPYPGHSYGSGDGAIFQASLKSVLQLFSKSSNMELYYGSGLTKPHGSLETHKVFNDSVKAILDTWNLKGIVVKAK